MQHLDDETLLALADGRDVPRARAHLEACAACRAELDARRSRHLDEVALEALAAGRVDLVSAEARAHAERCSWCRDAIETERAAVHDAQIALRRAMPELDDLDAMIARAMEVAPAAAAPSRRSLWTGACLGASAALVMAWLSLTRASLPGVGALTALGRQMLTVGRAIDSVVESTVPGGWGGVALVGLVLAVLLAVPVRLLLGERRRAPGLATGMLALLLASLVSAPALVARAYRVEGAWPDRRVTIDVDARPTSEALRITVESAGLGLVARLPEDPPVTLHVRDAPVGEVVHALLGDADVVVIPSANLVTIRPSAASGSAAPERAESAPRVEPRDEVVTTDSVRDRVTFGDDIEIAADEVVRGVYTMGGGARILGRALGDVVTMGGDAEVLGEVIGNVTTMGGDIRVRDGARVHGDLNAMGGDLDIAEGAVVHGHRLPAHQHEHHAAELGRNHDYDGIAELFRWGLWHALLFLIGLVMLGTMRDRLARITAELASAPIRSGLGGLFGLLAASMLAIVLCITIIGIPVAAILAAAIVVAALAGWTACAMWLGSVLPIRALKDRPVHQLAAGVLGLFVAGLVPEIGPLIGVVAVFVGLGAVVATKFGAKPRRFGAHGGPFRSR